MLRDDKHIDHFDMLHYAMADLDLKERQDSAAIAQLKISAQVSTTDQKQKAKTFLRLADIYFDDRAYADAQQYYDSTQTLMAEEHPRFEEVKTRARVLGELVEQLAIIAREDSLQALASLDEKDLEKKIRGIDPRKGAGRGRQGTAWRPRPGSWRNSVPLQTKPPTQSSGGAWYLVLL